MRRWFAIAAVCVLLSLGTLTSACKNTESDISEAASSETGAEAHSESGDNITAAPSTEEGSTVYLTEDPSAPEMTESVSEAGAEAESDAAAPAVEVPETYVKYCMAASLNVRVSPSTEAAVAATIPQSAEVQVISEADGWAEIWFDNSRYYVSSDYLTADPNWTAALMTKNGYANGAQITLDPGWRFADFSMIHSGAAVMYVSEAVPRKNIIVGVNAGHGTSGGNNVKTYCHPDYSPKVTGGTTAAGQTQAVAVSSGMTFNDGTPEYLVTLRMAQMFRDVLLANGYDVLMLRDGDDVQLDNVARTVICNNVADCHIAIHWDGDGLTYDKGCFCMTVPDGIKYMDPVSTIWQEDDRLGISLVQGLQSQGVPIHGSGTAQLDLTQTSFSSVPSIDIELGNQCSLHTDEELQARAYGMLAGVNIFFGQQ